MMKRYIFILIIFLSCGNKNISNKNEIKRKGNLHNKEIRYNTEKNPVNLQCKKKNIKLKVVESCELVGSKCYTQNDCNVPIDMVVKIKRVTIPFLNGKILKILNSYLSLEEIICNGPIDPNLIINIPNSIVNKLKRVRLLNSYNHIGFLKQLSKMKNLESIEFSFPVSKDDLKSISSLQNLKSISIVVMNEKLLKVFKIGEKLNELNLSNSFITDKYIGKIIQNSRNLKKVILNNCYLGDNFVRSITNSKIRILEVEDNYLSKSSLFYIKKMKKLEKIYVHNNILCNGGGRLSSKVICKEKDSNLGRSKTLIINNKNFKKYISNPDLYKRKNIKLKLVFSSIDLNNHLDILNYSKSIKYIPKKQVSNKFISKLNGIYNSFSYFIKGDFNFKILQHIIFSNLLYIDAREITIPKYNYKVKNVGINLSRKLIGLENLLNSSTLRYLHVFNGIVSRMDLNKIKKNIPYKELKLDFTEISELVGDKKLKVEKLDVSGLFNLKKLLENIDPLYLKELKLGNEELDVKWLLPFRNLKKLVLKKCKINGALDLRQNNLNYFSSQPIGDNEKFNINLNYKELLSLEINNYYLEKRIIKEMLNARNLQKLNLEESIINRKDLEKILAKNLMIKQLDISGEQRGIGRNIIKKLIFLKHLLLSRYDCFKKSKDSIYRMDCGKI